MTGSDITCHVEIEYREQMKEGGYLKGKMALGLLSLRSGAYDCKSEASQSLPRWGDSSTKTGM